MAFEYYDAFMIQVRGKTDNNRDNATHVGKFVKVPDIAKVIGCKGNNMAAATDKGDPEWELETCKFSNEFSLILGRPVLLGNLTFTWRAPARDEGSITIEASVVYNDAYVIVKSRPIKYKELPVVLRDCGRSLSCYRLCRYEPRLGNFT